MIDAGKVAVSPIPPFSRRVLRRRFQKTAILKQSVQRRRTLFYPKSYDGFNHILLNPPNCNVKPRPWFRNFTLNSTLYLVLLYSKILSMNSIKLLYFSILYTYYFLLFVCAIPLPGVLSSLPKYGLIPTKSRRSLQRSPQSHSLISLIWHRSSRTEDRTPITGLYSYFQTLHPPFVPCPVAKAHTALLSFKRPCDNAAAVLIRHYRPPEK
jgi:hypothetical protein